MRSVNIAPAKVSSVMSSQAPTMTRVGGKRKNHRGGRKTKKTQASKTKPQASSDTENDDIPAEAVEVSVNEPTKQRKPKTKKKKRPKKAKAQPELVDEKTEATIPQDEIVAPAEEQVDVGTKVGDPASFENEAINTGRNTAAKNTRKDDLIDHGEDNNTEATDQEVQGAAKEVIITKEDIGVLNTPEQDHLLNTREQDHLLKTPEQDHLSTVTEGVAIETPDDTAVALEQQAAKTETASTATTKKVDEDGATVKQTNGVAGGDNEDSKDKDDVGSKTVKQDQKSSAKDATAVLRDGDTLNTSKQDGARDVNEQAVIDAPQEKATATAQETARTEKEDAAAEKYEDSDSTVTPGNYVTNKHNRGSGVKDGTNGVAEVGASGPEEHGFKCDDHVAAAATADTASSTIPRKPDLRLSLPCTPNNEILTQNHTAPTSSPIYEIKPIAGKGIGMFATHPIPRGTRILHEHPLLLLERDLGGDIYDIPLKFSKMSPEGQAAFLSLAATPHAERDPNRLEWLQILSQSEAYAGFNMPMVERQRLLQIFETNSFSAGEGSAIVFDASRMNHSCTPNVYHNWNAGLGALTVHAIRDVETGEEIVTSYVNICVYQSARQDQLDRYGFNCDCKACDMGTKFGRASEARRQRLCVVNRQVVLRYLCPDRSELDNDDCTLGTVVEIIKILKEEGIVNMELTRQYANPQTPSLRTKPHLSPPIPLQQVEKRRADFA